MEDGVPLVKALRTVTSNPAALLKLPHKGRIAEGADADLVLADDKSLVVDTVLAKGVVMVSDGRTIVRGTFEAAP